MLHKISWTDHTVNFWWGCTKVSPACQHCYAETFARHRGKTIFGTDVLWGAGQPRAQRLERARQECLNITKKGRYCEPCNMRTPDHTCPQCRKPTRRLRVFVNSMSDWLDPEVPIEWLAYLLNTIRLCPEIDFQLLTKRPEQWDQRIAAISSYFDIKTIEGRAGWAFGAEWYLAKKPPPNIWLGTTVENQHTANMRIPVLQRIPAVVRFLSMEPLLGPVDLLRIDAQGYGGNAGHQVDCLRKGYWSKTMGFVNHSDMHAEFGDIHWIIIGGESGPKARPTNPDWFARIDKDAAAAGIALLFKQWGSWVYHKDLEIMLKQNRATQQSFTGMNVGNHLMLKTNLKFEPQYLLGRVLHQFPIPSTP